MVLARLLAGAGAGRTGATGRSVTVFVGTGAGRIGGAGGGGSWLLSGAEGVFYTLGASMLRLAVIVAVFVTGTGGVPFS